MAKRVEFLTDFEHVFRDRMGMLSIKAGTKGLFKDEVADAALAKGAAKAVGNRKAGDGE